MGASGWEYIQPFESDVQTTLAALRQRIFTGGDYAWYDSFARPATLADWDAMCAAEPDFEDPGFEDLMDIVGSGTASILDVHTVGSGQGKDIEPAAAADILMLFGTATPTRADFDRADLYKVVPEKWNGGYYVNLHDAAGAVEAIGFWGASGD